MADAYSSAAGYVRKNLIAFQRYRLKRYVVGGFHRIAASSLEDVVFGDLRWLMLTWPPRHGKTELMIGATALNIGNKPFEEIILSSADASLARIMSKKLRNVLRSSAFQGLFPGVLPARNSSSVDEWQIEKNGKLTGGVVRAAGIGQGIQGRGGHLIIGDDWVKNAKTANSKAHREAFQEFFESDLRDRLYPGGRMIVSHTRWRRNDPIGFLTSPEKLAHTPWRQINFPAQAADGSWLWPEVYPASEYELLRASMSRHAWAAKFQQDPLAVGENIIESAWFRVVGFDEVPKVIAKKGMGVDLSASEKETSDPRVAMPGFQDEFGRVWVLPPIITHDRWPTFKKKVEVLARALKLTLIIVESNQFQLAAVQQWQDDLRSDVIAVERYNADKDKVARAEDWTPFAANGTNVFLIEDGSGWTNHFLRQCEDFPLGEHDDMIDAFGLLVMSLRNLEGGVHESRMGNLADYGGISNL